MFASRKTCTAPVLTRIPRTAPRGRLLLPIASEDSSCCVVMRDPRPPTTPMRRAGTTVNQRTLVAFQKGAFLPGVAVQPVLVSYPFYHHGTDMRLMGMGCEH